MLELDFSGARVLVVGGSSGIGNGIAQRFRQQGAEVHVWGTRARAQDYLASDGCHLEGLIYDQMDVGDFDRVEAYEPPFTTLDVLVLAQGTVIYKRGEFSMDGFQKVIDVNLNSLMACANKFRAMLSASKGSVIILSSTAGFHTTVGNPAYSASKAGAVHLTRTLGQAWIGEGIRINGIAPGLVDTKLTKVTTQSPRRLATLLETVPIGRMGSPSEMGEVALFLASSMASYVVGQTIRVDGGMMA